MKVPVQFEIDETKKSSRIKIPLANAIKNRAVETVKKTATATKERAKARGITAVELAAGGLVTKTAATAAAALAGGIIKTATDSDKT